MNLHPVRAAARVRARRERPGGSARSARPLAPLLLPVTLTGAATIAAAAAKLVESPPSARFVAAVLVLAAASTLAEAFPVPMESVPGGSVSLAAVFVVGTGMLYGWPAALAVAVVTRVTLEIFHRRPLVRLVYNGSVYAIAGAAAGAASGLAPPEGGLAVITAVMFGATTFWFVNVVLVAAVISRWSGQRFSPLLTQSAYWTAVPFAIMASASLTLKVLWDRSPGYAAALVGPLVAIGLYQHSTHRALRAIRLALTDPLTGLGNHRHFHDELEGGLRRMKAEGRPLSLCLIDVDDFKRVNDRYGHPVGDRVLAQVGAQLRQDGEAFRLGGDEFALILTGVDEGDGRRVAERVAARLTSVLTEDGERLSVSAGVATFPRHARERSELLRVCDSALYRAKGEGKSCVRVYDPALAELAQLRRLPESVDRAARLRAAASLARSVDARDAYTGVHSERVAALAARLAARLGLSVDEVELVRLAGLLHDVGKLVVPERLLRKPGSLTPAERLVLEQHPMIGHSMLESLGIEPAAAWVRHHHERWDGDGYPDGLSGSAIPLGSRILFVADSYDAMTTDRTYRARLEHEDAVAELERCAGTQFDPTVVAALVEELGGVRRALAAQAS